MMERMRGNILTLMMEAIGHEKKDDVGESWWEWPHTFTTKHTNYILNLINQSFIIINKLTVKFIFKINKKFNYQLIYFLKLLQ